MMTLDDQSNDILHESACTSGGADGAAVIDFAHLKRYTLADQELERELLGLFASQAFVYLDALRAAANINAWREAAHTLKGSAKGVGAWNVADAAERAEQLGEGPRDSNASDALRQLEGAVGQARRFIDEYVRQN